MHVGGFCGICLASGFYVRAMPILEVMLALTLPAIQFDQSRTGCTFA